MITPIFRTIAEIQAEVAGARGLGMSIALVPTMGALHEGHAALIRAAGRPSSFVVVSIFVNPTQFGPNEDFAKYPRTLEDDQRICAAAGANAIFAPSVQEMYPGISPLPAGERGSGDSRAGEGSGFSKSPSPGLRPPSPQWGEGYSTFVDVAKLGDTLCGASRPGHFRGVCTVVLKLLNIVAPDIAYFGAKDYQQARIIQQMVGDLNVPVEIQIEPTVREEDGLALSSRNRYLSAEDRAAAPGIQRALSATADRVRAGETNLPILEASLQAELEAIPGARIDYARIVDASTLQPLAVLETPAVAAVAVLLGSTRLIDNIVLDCRN